MSREYVMLRLLVCFAALALPVSLFAECRVIEYPDHNEVVCGDDAVLKADQPAGKALSKLEATTQREFEFPSPTKAGVKISISADLSPAASATHSQTLISYSVIELINKEYITTTATFVFEETSEDGIFNLREEGTGERFGDPKYTSVKFNDKKNLLLFNPFKSGCSSSPADAVYLKMNRLEDGNQLHYQIILPACLSKLVEQSMPN